MTTTDALTITKLIHNRKCFIRHKW